MTKDNWLDVSRAKVECIACGRKRHCTVNEEGTKFICRGGVASDHEVKQKDGSIAYLHQADAPPGRAKVGKAVPPTPKITAGEAELRQKQFLTALSDRRRKLLAEHLGVMERSLRKYGCGWDDEKSCYSFPMRNAAGTIIGFSLRPPPDRPHEHKRCVRGSRLGLFIPEGFDVPKVPFFLDDEFSLLLLTPEGVSDCCAADSMGFRAVGRPSNTACAEMLRDFLGRWPKQDVVVVADRDEPKKRPDGTTWLPGVEGALSVARTVLGNPKNVVCGRLRFGMPPGESKDLRGWLNGGGHHGGIMEMIDKSNLVTPAWLDFATKELEKRRRAAG